VFCALVAEIVTVPVLPLQGLERHELPVLLISVAADVEAHRYRWEASHESMRLTMTLLINL
jgi:hypothetical protein